MTTAQTQTAPQVNQIKSNGTLNGRALYIAAGQRTGCLLVWFGLYIVAKKCNIY